MVNTQLNSKKKTHTHTYVVRIDIMVFVGAVNFVKNNLISGVGDL